ncbi:hypothetical protein GCM10028807_41370 [Spirosoma daeguense]
MDPKKLQELIHRYQNGLATPQEHQLLEAYWQQMLQQDALRNVSDQEKGKLGHKMYQTIRQTIQTQEPASFTPMHRWLGQPWMTMAASLTGFLLLLGAIWLWLYPRSSALHYETAYGEKQHIVLPEGSEVWLNGHSVLRYVPDSAGNRQVWLEGEAQFLVRHTATHQKFIVHTANQLAVEVLGTVFNVVNRRGAVNVVLHSGSVRIVDGTHLQPDVLLKPNEMVSQTRKKVFLTKSSVKAQQRLAWKDGAMYVENKPLGEIFDWIQDTYGISVTCPPSLRDETFAGTVPTDSIESFFTIIPKLYQVNVQKDGQLYRIE